MVSDQENKELLANQKPKWYILMPSSSFYMVWQLIMIILIGYFATYIPFEIAFLAINDTVFCTSIDYAIDAMFVFDIILNFFTAFEIEKTKRMEISLKVISISYLSSWFLIDVIATFPF